MSNYVHLKVEYYPPGKTRKKHIKVKVDAKRWDHQRFARHNYLNGHLKVAGGTGSKLANYHEVKRTKT